MQTFFSNFSCVLTNAINKVNPSELGDIARLILKVKAQGKKVILIGNGGSAAMASHVSVDLTKAAGIRAINFNEADLITCLANDYGHENWMAKALEFYADLGDLVILISSSGYSKNIVNAGDACLHMGLDIITLTGFSPKNLVRNQGKVNLWVDSSSYNIVEMTHHIWLLAIVDYIIDELRVR